MKKKLITPAPQNRRTPLPTRRIEALLPPKNNCKKSYMQAFESRKTLRLRL